MIAVLRHLRLPSGLILFAFVASHLVNHALGIVSLGWMEAGQSLFQKVWAQQPGITILAAAFTAHVLNALAVLWQRRSLRMQAWEAAQLVLGLAIPLLLARHVFGTYVAEEAYGVATTYRYVLAQLWIGAPFYGGLQVATLIVAWTHGCIGLHFWLRMRKWYRQATPIAFAVALVLPALALAGYVAAGSEVLRLAEQEGWFRQAMRAADLSPEAVAFVQSAERWTAGLYIAAVGGVMLARFVRDALYHRSGPKLYYRDRRVLPILPGATVLETILAAGIPHAMVCGGRGRCSTCRVRVGFGSDALLAPQIEEMRVLDRIAAPPAVRLACQIRPRHDLEVTPLLPPTATATDGSARAGTRLGQERDLAILFTDLRGFTRLAENRLPYDTVFLLNRYFAAVGTAVEEAGGRVDKFIGDGVMALFGVDDSAANGSRQALAAVRLLAVRLDELNAAFAGELPEPLRMGVGLHVGAVIVGEMGYGQTRGLTAIGDAVNTASRLEGLCKGFGVEMVVSQAVLDRAGVDLPDLPAHEVEIRGRREPLAVRLVARLSDLGA
jgi:adenylate cyclase